MDGLESVLQLDNILGVVLIVVIILWFKRGVTRDRMLERIVTDTFEALLECIKENAQSKD